MGSCHEKVLVIFCSGPNVCKFQSCLVPVQHLRSQAILSLRVVGRLGRKKKRAPFLFFRLLLFLQGYPTGASAKERAGLMHVGDVSETNGQKTSSDHVT